MLTPNEIQEIKERFKSYFGNGGLFNPEMMEHDKVGELVRDSEALLDKLLLDREELLKTLLSIIKESTAYKNPQTVGDGYLVQAVLWLEQHGTTKQGEWAIRGITNGIHFRAKETKQNKQ